MLILLCVVLFILTGICVVLSNLSDDGWYIISMVTSVGFIISFIATVIVLIEVTENDKIDDLLAMYQEENQTIENHMDDLVKGYMDYESETLEKFSPDSSITLVSLYPDLKSDELVRQQIDLYMVNNAKIKELRERKIYAGVYRWWLYFGK